jgi:hypothetical protein
MSGPPPARPGLLPGRELPRMSEVGRTIYRVVKEQPGIHFRGLGRAAGLTSAGQLRHHLDRLERQGLLVELEDGRYKRFFVAGDHDRTLRPGLARFARQVPRKIGKLLLVHPMNRTELRRSLGCADSTLGYHLKRMMEQGDLEKNRGRNCCKYSLTRPELVQKVLMLQGAEPGWQEEGDEEAHPPQAPSLAPELPALGMPMAPIPGLTPEPDEEPPEPLPEPIGPEPIEVPPDLGTPAPEVVPLYLLPTGEEPELPGLPGLPEPPQEEPPAEAPEEPEPVLPEPADEGFQKVQEP